MIAAGVQLTGIGFDTTALAQIVGPAAGTSLYATSPDMLWGDCVVLGALAAALMLSPASRPRYATTASRSTSAA
jgi:hypothetical protein